jgi:NADPH:quinone reductase-like Zn-dependent oxidoreductase
MDITQREGNYPGIPPGSSDILGVEFSGHITALGLNTSLGWQTGDEVLGLASGVSRLSFIQNFLISSQTPDISAHILPWWLLQGAYAEFIAVPETQILRKPPQLSWTDAACIPEAFITGTSPKWPHQLFLC